MKKIISIFLYVASIVVLVIISHSCANIGTITGGPKDSIPPEVIGSKPPMFDTSFAEDKIVIYFNEYFELKDINQEFVASPPFVEMPDFKIKKRSLHVKFKEPLQDSLTYTLNFGNAIADFNEGNILENYRFVFSTKSEIDSFSIGGNLKNAFDLKVPENTFVMIFKNNEDSLPYKDLPNYISKIDTSGNFSIDYILPGSYKIFGLNDLNTNKRADEFEPRAFLDSLIIPEREAFTRIDSLKAGTILHYDDPTLSDSLINDTVIITKTFRNYPLDIQLYMFEEANLKQRLADYSRSERGKHTFFFDLPEGDDFKINPINFNIADENIVIERNLTNDTITWWINDTTVMAMDSLEIDINYQTLDSLGNPVPANDTIILEYREKKDNDAWKRKKEKEKETPKKQYLQLEYLAKENKIDLNKRLGIQLPTPLKEVDTSKIRLFEIYDTTTVDTKKQEIIKAFRLRKDLLSFKFKRKVVNDFFITPINFRAANWYTIQASDSNRVYTCQITNNDVASMDTLKLMVNHDNHFFFDQIQELSDTVILPITAQKITSRKRDKAEEIVLTLYKPLRNELKVIPDDFTARGNWYTVARNNTADTVKIILLDKNVSNKDTLTLAVRCFDYIDLNNDSVFFEETMRLIFSEPKQFLVTAGRLKRNELSLIFNKPMRQNPDIQPLNFTMSTSWNQLRRNNAGDSLTYTITDEFVSKMDTLKLVFSYKDTDRRGKVYNIADTVEFISNKSNDFKQRTTIKQTTPALPVSETVHIYLPREYEFFVDSLNIRQRLIGFDWKEDTKYLLRLDSMAFTDIFNVYNQFGDYEFASRALDYYTTLTLNLINIKANKQLIQTDSLAISTASKDSVPSNVVPKKKSTISQKQIDSVLGTGQIIVQLLNKDGIVVKEYIVNEDKQIVMDFLHPGDYNLKIIFDRNGNGKWDTGNYFKHIQPERVIMSGKPVKLASDIENILDWPVGESLIKSFTND